MSCVRRFEVRSDQADVVFFSSLRLLLRCSYENKFSEEGEPAPNFVVKEGEAFLGGRGELDELTTPSLPPSTISSSPVFSANQLSTWEGPSLRSFHLSQNAKSHLPNLQIR